MRRQDKELAQSLQDRTLESLDFGFVADKLRGHCCTAKAFALTEDYATLLVDTAEKARSLYAEVTELTRLEDADLMLSASMDIEELVDDCGRGTVLNPPELRDISITIEALLKLRRGLEGAAARGVELDSLLAYAEEIELPDELLDLMIEAFTDDFKLSEKKFPELARMRVRIEELQDECARAIRRVLASGKYMAYLADDGYMEVGGHYVLSVKRQHCDKVGVVMDESRSGKTVYVEPHEVVDGTRELIELQQELKFTTRRILGQMCVQVSKASNRLKRCLETAARIDLARARLFLGEEMEGDVPEVGDEGILRVRHARNPTLCLRGGIRVVGYPVELGTGTQGLILSGPNAGGKTVVLKTLGLLALLARCGIPVPAGEDPRVDFFDVVLAEVGDMQTVEGDLSTYSAHLVASRIMMGCCSTARERSLVMVDEAGGGTDPTQGAALARAVLEALLESGARVVSTTHCDQLKNWAAKDSRLETAAMEYRKGRPTFRLTRNAVGESHAIETARRLELPDAVVQRAEELLCEDQRSLMNLQRQAEKREEDLKLQLAEAKERELAAREKDNRMGKELEEAMERNQELRERGEALFKLQEQWHGQVMAEHRNRVSAHEQRLEEILSSLSQENGGGESRVKIVGDAIEELRLERDEAKELANAAQKAARLVPGAMSEHDALLVGDWVVVLARTVWYGFKARVQKVNRGVGKTPTSVTIRLDGEGKQIIVRKTELGRTVAPATKERIAAARKNKKAAPSRDYAKAFGKW